MAKLHTLSQLLRELKTGDRLKKIIQYLEENLSVLFYIGTLPQRNSLCMSQCYLDPRQERIVSLRFLDFCLKKKKRMRCQIQGKITGKLTFVPINYHGKKMSTLSVNRLKCNRRKWGKRPPLFCLCPPRLSFPLWMKNPRLLSTLHHQMEPEFDNNQSMNITMKGAPWGRSHTTLHMNSL